MVGIPVSFWDGKIVRGYVSFEGVYIIVGSYFIGLDIIFLLYAWNVENP